jgi:hypothetical protein
LPGPVSWWEDSPADEAVIAANVADLLTDIARDAARRETPSLALAHQWHRRIFAGTGSPPGSRVLGVPRGSPHPDLRSCEVMVANPSSGVVSGCGVPAAQVASYLAGFEQGVQTAAASLDAVIDVARGPQTTAELESVVRLAALCHGEWVRIHPYMNGNGRVARTWANWVAVRYGLPPFVRIRPRPDGLWYAAAARNSMGIPPDYLADHEPTFRVFLQILLGGLAG